MPKAEADPIAMIRARNIFDPNRRPGRRADAAQEEAAPARPQALVLTGTMVHSGRVLAFFGGSESEFRRVISVGDQVGRFTVVRIDKNEVELTQDDTRFVLGVGRSLKRTGDGPWALSQERYTADTSASGATAARPGPGSEPPVAVAAPAAGAGDGEMLKRMMERRRQEESK
jgi:hypothetical protein